MLTDIYYYNFYKPYILKNFNRSKIANSRFIDKIKYGNTGENGKSFVLNKAFKTNVIDYANQLSETIITIKEASKNLVQNIEEMSLKTYNEGYGITKRLLCENLAKFMDGYNKTIQFTEANKDSQSLFFYSENLSLDVDQNKKQLSKYGLNISSDGSMVFEHSVFYGLDLKKLNETNILNFELFKNTYDITCDFLQIPLSEHMNFKNLGYYYNYRLGSVQKDTFKIIETGLIIDKAI